MHTGSSTENNQSKTCRTCVDFKTWAKQQRSKHPPKSEKESGTANSGNKPSAETGRSKYGCPVDKDELGVATWTLLHTMAAVYPDRPTQCQKRDMTTFFSVFSRLYPCDVCAKDLAKELKDEPVEANSQREFSQWLCRLHNKVNKKLGKPEFDCTKINERWRDGWLDGSCD